MLYPFSNRFSYFLTISGENVLTSVTPLEPLCVSYCELESLSNIAFGSKGYILVVWKPDAILLMVILLDHA